MFQVVTKLKQLKHSLKALHRERFANVEKEAQVALTRLTDLQKAIYQQPSNEELHNQEEFAKQ